jgi:hypothetical protein
MNAIRGRHSKASTSQHAKPADSMLHQVPAGRRLRAAQWRGYTLTLTGRIWWRFGDRALIAKAPAMADLLCDLLVEQNQLAAGYR